MRSFTLTVHKNLSAGTLLQTPLAELTAPLRPLAHFEGHFMVGRGRKREREKGRRNNGGEESERREGEKCLGCWG